MSRLKLLAATAVLIPFAAVTGHATVYDAVSGFALLPASAAPFSYGYRIGAGAFTPYDSTTASCAGIGGLACNYAAGFNNNTLPAVGKNTTGSLIVNGSVRIPTDELFLHPVGLNSGLPAGDTIVRFTAPTAGTYQVSGLFQLIDVSPSGVAVSIEGGTLPFAAPLAGPYLTTANFSFSTVLLAGGTLDFVVDPAGSYFNDSTGLSATITSSDIPEPASMALLGLGLTAMAAVRRRRA